MRNSVLILVLSILPVTLFGQRREAVVCSVNFVSLGEGIDTKAVDQLTTFVQQFQQEYKNTLPVSIRHWGREGEVEYQIDLSTLRQRQRKVFKEKIKEMYRNNKRVDLSGTL